MSIGFAMSWKVRTTMFGRTRAGLTRISNLFRIKLMLAPIAAISGFDIIPLTLPTPLPFKSDCVVSEIAWLQQSTLCDTGSEFLFLAAWTPCEMLFLES